MRKGRNMKQTESILQYMKNYGGITPMDALKDIGCMRLAARIADLRRDGHRIKGEKIEVRRRDGSKALVERYQLDE